MSGKEREFIYTFTNGSQLVCFCESLAVEGNGLRKVRRAGFEDEPNKLARVPDGDVRHNRINVVRKAQIVNALRILVWFKL